MISQVSFPFPNKTNKLIKHHIIFNKRTEIIYILVILDAWDDDFFLGKRCHPWSPGARRPGPELPLWRCARQTPRGNGRPASAGAWEAHMRTAYIHALYIYIHTEGVLMGGAGVQIVETRIF